MSSINRQLDLCSAVEKHEQKSKEELEIKENAALLGQREAAAFVRAAILRAAIFLD